ncbi:MAG: ATP synthase subunit b [Calditrichaeota bacterium]|nr:ATP synthase subunit b [Calditrichota bacterium]
MRHRIYLVAPALLAGSARALASESEGLGGLISLEPGSILYTLLSFILLLIILWKFAWGPIVKGLEKREHDIHGAIEAAKQDREQAEKLLQQYREKLEKASGEVSERIGKAEKQAQQTIEAAKQQAREQADKLREQAKQEIEASKEKASAELRAEVAELAAKVAAAAIGESFDRDDQLRIIRRRLKQVENGS